MASRSLKSKPDIPMVLTENLGGYLIMAGRFVAYLDYKEPPKDDDLVRIAQAISDMRLQPGLGLDYEAFMFRVSAQWSYRRMAEHFMSSEASMRRRVKRARLWILARLEETAAA